MSNQRIVYGGMGMPDVEVLVDGSWWPGEVRMVTELDDGTWEHNVSYKSDIGRFLGTFHDDHIRKDTGDRTGGRLNQAAET